VTTYTRLQEWISATSVDTQLIRMGVVRDSPLQYVPPDCGHMRLLVGSLLERVYQHSFMEYFSVDRRLSTY